MVSMKADLGHLRPAGACLTFLTFTTLNKEESIKGLTFFFIYYIISTR